MYRAVLLTSIPSPYMVELVDAINKAGRWIVTVIYIEKQSRDRRWSSTLLNHDHIFFQSNNSVDIEYVIKNSDLIVIGSLWGKATSTILDMQREFLIPLVLWGEKPGAVHRHFLAENVRRLMIRWRFRRARTVWGIGEWAVAEYKTCFPNVSQFESMPYASNLEDYFKIERQPVDVMATHKPIRFLYSGSLIHRKGVDLLVDAFNTVLEEGHDACLTLMGHGELEKELRSKVKDAHRDKVVFLGFKDWHELPAVYARHDVLVAPSRYDGWGLIVIEGLAAGMPVIATDRMGAALDFIKNGENGWVISASNEKYLVTAIKSALRAPVSEMSCAARNSVQMWTLETAANLWCDLADRAL
jgi:glycosyltransferase involved in cell wall biosynthesis